MDVSLNLTDLPCLMVQSPAIWILPFPLRALCGDTDLSQHVCTEERLRWVSLFTHSPKERKQEERVSSLEVGI